MKCARLSEIKHIRSIRDEIMVCNNSGRLFELINKFPIVSGINHNNGGWSEARLEVRISGGYSFVKYSSKVLSDDSYLQMGCFLYHLWRDCLRKHKNINSFLNNQPR